MEPETVDNKLAVKKPDASTPVEVTEPANDDPGQGSEPNNTVPDQPVAQSGTETSKNRRKQWIWIMATMVVLLGVMAVVWHLRKASSKQQSKSAASGGTAGQGSTITTGQAKTGDINVYLTALGTVTPMNTITVNAQVTGRAMTVFYHEGQIVTQGQPLVEIDPRPYQATLIQAEGTLQHDRGVLAESRIDLTRYQTAFARNAIARQQMEDQEQAVEQYEGTVKADEGAVTYDAVQLSYCHIVAPITGRVGLRLVDPGNTVFSGSSSTLVIITQLQPITVVFNVSEDDLSQVQTELKKRRKLVVSAFDRSNQQVLEAGMLTALDNQVDTATGTIKFRASFFNRSLKLFPNQFVNAQLLVRTLKGTTLVPTAAVQHNGTAAFVYVVKPNMTVGVQPILTQTGNDQVTAVTGVPAGTTVATSGFEQLENGTKVVMHAQSEGNTQAQGSSGATTGNKAP